MQTGTRRPTAVFDLDGTLTDTSHRDHLISRSPKRWDDFFAGAADDQAHDEGLAALDVAVEQGCEIVYLSGRPERLRRVTEAWLRDHDCPRGTLLLRGNSDRSPSTSFKLRALRKLAGSRRLVLLVDDDRAVVKAVRQERHLVEKVLLANWQGRVVSTPFDDG